MSTAPTVREKRPSTRKGLIFIVVLALVIAGLAAFALSLRSEEGPKLADAAPDAVPVTVAPVTVARDFELAEKFSGLATASRESQLGFTSGGRIDELRVDIGDRVERGQSLARLDTRSLSAQLRAAEATIEEAVASADIALATQRRQEQLLTDGHVSPQRVDEAVAQTQAASARVLAAQAQADTLRVQIDLSRITAPFDGVITNRFVDEGVIANPGAPVFQLVETGALEARIGVPASVASSLTAGQSYVLSSDGRDVTAVLRSITGVIDMRQRTVMTVFEIDDPDARIAAGAVVRLSVNRTVSEPGTWVPVTALTEVSRGVWSVLVAENTPEGWRATPRPVIVVHSDGARAFVRGSLEDGDRLILEGLQRVVPNQPVTPREAAYADRITSSQ